jgi:hypothetical protein
VSGHCCSSLLQQQKVQGRWFEPHHHAPPQVSTADVNDYRASVKAGLRRAISEVERDWGSGAPGAGPRAHWVIVYVRPANVDPQDKVSRWVGE